MNLANQFITGDQLRARTRPPRKERAARGSGVVGLEKRRSALESNFLRLWNLLGGPELEREYVACPPRKWRFDFAHILSRTLVEIHGGIFSHGRHTRGIGFANDRQKMNAAQAAGWCVVELTSADINSVRVGELIAQVRRAV